jgi:hypothetical protein
MNWRFSCERLDTTGAMLEPLPADFEPIHSTEIDRPGIAAAITEAGARG